MEPIITINEYPIGWEWLDISSEEDAIYEVLTMPREEITI